MKGLPDFREVPDREFDAAIKKYHQKVPVEGLTDQELWVLYTKWSEVDTRCAGESPYAVGLRASAGRYLRVLLDECARRGIIKADPETAGKRNAGSGLRESMERHNRDMLEKAPGADPAVLRFITDFACCSARTFEGYEILRSTFRAGYCWYFAHMLKLAFGRGEVCWAAPFSHFVWVDADGTPYDVEGVNFGEQIYHIPERYLSGHVQDFMHVPGTDAAGASQDDIREIIRRYEADTGQHKYTEGM